MMRTFSQLFAGPIDKDGKQAEGPADETSTAPGSDGSSDDTEASIPSAGASDASVETFARSEHFEPDLACVLVRPEIDDECAEDRGGHEKTPQSPVCAQAAQSDDDAPGIDPARCSAANSARAAVEGPICEEPPMRCIARREESDESGERGVELGGSPDRRPTPASQSGDGQAKRRAMKRYRVGATGHWVKGCAHDDGR